MKQLFLIFIGGGAGSVLRYLLHQAISKAHNIPFPIGTLAVNILGSFLIGVVYALSLKAAIGDNIRLFLAVGLCGGFTTFSSFSFDSMQLLRNQQTLAFITYAVVSVIVCLTFVWLGDILGKALIK